MRRRVVVADDSPMYLELLAIVLNELKQLNLVGAAANGREAVELAVERDADVVLLDVELPILNGFVAATEIRRLRPQTDVLLHTALRLDEHRRHGGQLDLVVYDKLELPRTIQLLARPTSSARSQIVERAKYESAAKRLQGWRRHDRVSPAIEMRP
jgi:DNA-binding NarL/FixJ family response regulator